MHEFYEVLFILYHFITTEDNGLAISGVFSLVTVHSLLLGGIQLLEVNVLLSPTYHYTLQY